MPYASDAQRRFFHTATARRKGITAQDVAEYDEASKGMTLPERQEPKKDEQGESPKRKALRSAILKSKKQDK
jgi:hypothetical protein